MATDSAPAPTPQPPASNESAARGDSTSGVDAPAPAEPKPRELVGYGDCRCVLTQYCDGTCNAIYEDAAVVERAKTLYAKSPQAYRGTRPLPWPRAPLPTRLEFIEKAKATSGVSVPPDQTPPPSHADAESPARGGRQG